VPNGDAEAFMDKYQQIVNNIQIATPCSADWNAMSGDDRKRFCQMCKLNVYNIEEMSPKEVSELISSANGGRVCMQIYRRRDGTVITRDCPVAVQRVKKAFKRSVAAVATFAATIGLSLPASAQQCPSKLTKGDARSMPLRGAIAPERQPLLGDTYAPADLPEVVGDPHDSGPSESPHLAPIKKPLWQSVLPWAMVAVIFAAVVTLMRKRSSMIIIGFTLGGLFAAFGYLWYAFL
jgi:hypothetical protein